MLIATDFKPESIYEYAHELIRMAFPLAEIQVYTIEDPDLNISIHHFYDNNCIKITGSITDTNKLVKICRYHKLSHDQIENRKNINRNTRRLVFDLLSAWNGKKPSTYGILTGVRPVKLIHQFYDRGLNNQEIINRLSHDYKVNYEKSVLMCEVANNNRTFLLSGEKAARLVSVYIGIPFCPSRCYYCSFPGAILNDYCVQVKPFLTCLWQEMIAVGELLKRRNLLVQSIYIGGGTPTVLTLEDQQKLFEILYDWYISEATVEITVEAGRPDTLSVDELRFFAGAGVNRVCINPQTMQDNTLKLIGRNHDHRDIINAVEWARDAGIRQINMDIIIGLPGEGPEQYHDTAARIIKLKPENLTVHTLALKRGSAMAMTEGKDNLEDKIEIVENGIREISQYLIEHGYLPYYLYRQKYMKAALENVGYALPGNFCHYNIKMMEERQTIIGLGAGAASKYVNYSNWSLTSFYNPKNPEVYQQSLTRIIANKVDNLGVVH